LVFLRFLEFVRQRFPDIRSVPDQALLEDNVSAAGLLLEGFLGGDDIVFDDVVARMTQIFSPSTKGSASRSASAMPAFAFLIGVMNAMEIKILPIGEQAKEVA